MHRLAIVASHPIQYHSPWYRRLTREVDLHVYYAHEASAEDQAGAGFGVPFEWDTDLLEGYSYSWLPNRARRPNVETFLGCNTPSVGAELTRRRYDAVLVHGWNLLCYWQAVHAAKSCCLPVMVRGDSHLQTPRSSLRRIIKRLAYPWLLGHFDAFLSVGHHNTEYLTVYRVCPDKIFHVPHCVDNEFFRATAGSARGDLAGLRRRFHIPPDATVFLFVGKFLPRKRPLDFLAGLDRVKLRGKDVWGLLIGAGPLETQLRGHAARYATPCSFGGFLNQGQIAAAYALADALVLPSNGEETWGLVVNEAMACGVPAIVSDAVGCAPDLIVDGETGFAYHEGELDQLTTCMERLVADSTLRVRMAQQAAAHIQTFSLDAACEGLLCALDSLMLPRCGHE